MNAYLTLTEACVWAAIGSEDAVDKERPAETAVWLTLYSPENALRPPTEVYFQLPGLCEQGKLTAKIAARRLRCGRSCQNTAKAQKFVGARGSYGESRLS